MLTTMMKPRPARPPSTKLRIVSTSDVHLYHPRVPDSHIIETLLNIIKDDGTAREIDMLIIAGDLFDRAVPFGDEAVTPILATMIQIMRFCERNDIVLIILYGTPRHDRKQSRRMEDLRREMGIKVEMIYAETLSIHYIARFGINVLMIPDEWRTDVKITLAEVKELMASKGLEQVDFAVMHGCFPHQLPAIPEIRAKAHDAEAYLALVRYQIFIGHHHTFSQYDRIVAHGSPTRLKQGEEEPKGYVLYDLMEDDSWRLTFIENELAWTFKTLKAQGFSYGEMKARIDDMDLRPGSFINIEANPTDECSVLFKKFSKEFPDIRMELVRPSAKEKADKAKDLPTLVQGDIPQLHEHNVVTTIEDYLKGRQHQPSLIQECVEILKHEQSLIAVRT